MDLEFPELVADATLHMPKHLQDVAACDYRDTAALLSLGEDVAPMPVRLDLYLDALWESVLTYIDGTCPRPSAPMRYVLTVEDALTALFGIFYTAITARDTVKAIWIRDEESPSLCIRINAKQPSATAKALLALASKLRTSLSLEGCARTRLLLDEDGTELVLRFVLSAHHADVGMAYRPHAAHIGSVLRAAMRCLSVADAARKKSEKSR